MIEEVKSRGRIGGERDRERERQREREREREQKKERKKEREKMKSRSQRGKSDGFTETQNSLESEIFYSILVSLLRIRFICSSLKSNFLTYCCSSSWESCGYWLPSVISTTK